jgi:putative endonuclease
LAPVGHSVGLLTLPAELQVLDGASIYILECADGSYYTGITRRSVEERVSEHAQGLIPGCYTFRRRPIKLIFNEHYERIADAVAAERRIKGWSRAKKEAYMRGDFGALVAWRDEARTATVDAQAVLERPSRRPRRGLLRTRVLLVPRLAKFCQSA